jgi:hypothetical protein
VTAAGVRRGVVELFRSPEVRIRAVIMLALCAAVAVVVPVVLTAVDGDDGGWQPPVQPAPVDTGQRRDALYSAALRSHGFEDENYWVLRQTARDVCTLHGRGWPDDTLTGYVWGRHPVSVEDAQVWVRIVTRIYCDHTLDRLTAATTKGAPR